MRRRLPRLNVILVWLALMALPLTLCLTLSYGLSLYHFRSETQSLADANARRAADILRSGDALLAQLAQTTGGECTPQSIAAMNTAVFHSVYFREAGIERNGNLVCTSLEMLPPGFDIPNAKRKPAARIGDMEILSPTKTIQGGKSLILNRPLRSDRSHFINLLLDPQMLVETIDHDEGLLASTFLDDSPNGLLFELGNASAPSPASQHAPLRPGVHRNADGLYAVARAGPYPVYTVISVGSVQIAEHWRTQMQPAVVMGFLLTGLAIVLLRRYLPRQSQTQDLREGIAAAEMLVEYQPIVDARDRRIVGAEALVRWRHPKRGLVMPDDFIALAESSGLIAPLTEHVLSVAKHDIELLTGEMPDGFRISINLARAHLADRSFLSAVDRVFGADTRLERLGFEITERELLANVADQARKIVKELARRGAVVSLDDFGTGYSGLSHLRHLTLHYIKVDRSFVWALDTEAVTASLVESIVSLAGSLEMGLVAEGVETEQQRTSLLALGVNLQQGWLYARSLSIEELRSCLVQQRVAAAEPAA